MSCRSATLFFSSRRRHTRLQGDWSSDVCSSDLLRARGDLMTAGAIGGLQLPQPLGDAEPVRSIRTPARLEYAFTAGEATSRFLRGIAAQKILGERCPVCGKVMLPPRGSGPIDGVPTSEQVELADRGIVTTFCVVNVQFSGSAMELPYVCASVLPDGADMGLFG